MKAINGANGYFACADGKIYSSKSNLFLKPRALPNGYERVYLTMNDGGRKDFLIHRLICAAFHGDAPNEKSCVNHKDGDKSNNSASNLEWVNHTENMNHASQLGLLTPQVEHMKKVNLSRRKPVAGYNSNGEMVVKFSMLAEARKAGYSAVSVALKTGKPSAGLTWKLL